MATVSFPLWNKLREQTSGKNRVEIDENGAYHFLQHVDQDELPIGFGFIREGECPRGTSGAFEAIAYTAHIGDLRASGVGTPEENMDRALINGFPNGVNASATEGYRMQGLKQLVQNSAIDIGGARALRPSDVQGAAEGISGDGALMLLVPWNATVDGFSVPGTIQDRLGRIIYCERSMALADSTVALLGSIDEESIAVVYDKSVSQIAWQDLDKVPGDVRVALVLKRPKAWTRIEGLQLLGR